MDERNIGNVADHDTSDENDETVDMSDQFDTPQKPPQIEAWKMPDAEGLPDDVRTSPIPAEGQGEDDGSTVNHMEGE